LTERERKEREKEWERERERTREREREKEQQCLQAEGHAAADGCAEHLWPAPLATPHLSPTSRHTDSSAVPCPPDEL
jgi:hypothetical protein